MVTSLFTNVDPLSYANLYSHILTYEFLHKSSFQPMSATTTTPLLPTPTQPPSAFVASRQPSSSSLENQTNNAQLLDLLQRLSIKALVNKTFKVLLLKYLLIDLQITLTFVATIWCDNLGVTYLSANPILHTFTKHVEANFHFLRDRVAKKDIQIHFISFKDQLVNIFTKPLTLLFFFLIIGSSFGLNPYLQLEGAYYKKY